MDVQYTLNILLLKVFYVFSLKTQRLYTFVAGKKKGACIRLLRARKRPPKGGLSLYVLNG